MQCDNSGSILDPVDWSGPRSLGHEMVDEMLETLRTVADRPLHVPMPDEVRRFFRQRAPKRPTELARVYEDFKRFVLPYPHGNIHPRFWGWVMGTGTVGGMFAELLAAGMNTNAGFGDHAPAHVEEQVLGWLGEALGLGSGSSGVLVSGCTLANLTGLTMARDVHAGWNVREDGVGAAYRQLRVYGSSETHSSNLRALELLGVGRRAFRSIPVDAEDRVDVDALRASIERDRELGDRPIAILGNAGTVNIGAFDDLEALAAVRDEAGIWLHVDGAFGAMVGLTREHNELIRGLELADSVAFDLHKWLHVPYDCGCVLVRDASNLPRSFGVEGAYLADFDSPLAAGPRNYMSASVQMSRGFRALKVWITIREHGLTRLGEAIERNVRQARRLAELVDAEPELERAAPVPLNIVNFRYVPPGLPQSDGVVDELNQRIVQALHRSGEAAPTFTRIDGRFVIRASITNHRTRDEDLGVLVESVLRHGRALACGA